MSIPIAKKFGGKLFWLETTATTQLIANQYASHWEDFHDGDSRVIKIGDVWAIYTRFYKRMNSQKRYL